MVREWGGMAVPGRVVVKRVDLGETWTWIQILTLLFTSFLSSSKLFFFLFSFFVTFC